MKTSKRFILVSLMLLGGAAHACSPMYYSASDNRLYRILPPLWKTTTTVGKDFATQNILLWSRQTGCRDTAAIRAAIYKGSLAQWEDLYRMSGSSTGEDGWFEDNTFVRHLTECGDTYAIELLCFSKRYESIRNAQRSPWYYDSRTGTDEESEMRRLYAGVCTRLSDNTRYTPRWLFLAIKCAWATQARDSAIEMWQKYAPRLRGGIFFDEAEDYVARCLMELGRDEEAYAIYRKHMPWIGKIPSCASLPTRLRIMLKIKPNAEEYASLLQDYLTTLDIEQAATAKNCYKGTDCFKTDSVLSVARMAINNPHVLQKDMWKYTAACILDYQGRQRVALEVLAGARNGDGDAFLRKSVRIMTFHLRAMTEPMTDDFERYALGEIRWIDSEGLREWANLPQEDRIKISKNMNWRWNNDINKVYSYAALRRIVLQDSVGLAWRMAGAGREVRAIQMANMADNRLVEVSDNQVIKSARTTDDGPCEVAYLDRDGNFRYVVFASLQDTILVDGHNFECVHTYGNTHDYSNGMFVLADGLSARTLELYRQRQLRPVDDADRWFNARSYTDGDYWQEIIGTHYLREHNYSAAVAHLKYVAPAYQRRMNIVCDIDPFSIDGSGECHDDTLCKLHFAQRMDSLRRAMYRGDNADNRGLAMLEYTIGLENSFGMCWWFTSYQKGWGGTAPMDIAETEYAAKARAVVYQLRNRALLIMHSDDARARYHLRLGHYATVRKHYAATPTGQHLALVCDDRSMYQPRYSRFADLLPIPR